MALNSCYRAPTAHATALSNEHWLAAKLPDLWRICHQLATVATQSTVSALLQGISDGHQRIQYVVGHAETAGLEIHPLTSLSLLIFLRF